MIEIMHCKPGDFANTMRQHIVGEIFKLKINRGLVEEDIARLESQLGKVSRIDDVNIKAILRQLKKLLGALNENEEAEVCWAENRDKLIETYPVKIFAEPIYGVNICNYLKIAPYETLVQFDLSDMAELIAFEYIHRDINHTQDSIEELMKDCSVVGYSSAECLTDMFAKSSEKMYYLSKILRISDSPWLDKETKTIYDYFHKREFKADKYGPVVEYSAMTIALILVASVMKKCNKLGMSCTPVMITANAVAVIIRNTKHLDLSKEFNEPVSLQLFGRQLIVDVKPQVI